MAHRTPPQHTRQPHRSRQRYSQHVHPTSRDLAIFAYVAELGVASAEQIHRMFWPQARLQTCRDRLAQLAKGGYLHTTTTDARRQVEDIFWIERKASLLFSETERQAQTRGVPASAELAHLLRTRDILDRLSSTGQLVAFKNEHQLKGEKVMRGGRLQIADGELTLAPGTTGAAAERTQTVLLEVDGAYYGKRLQQKVRDLGRAEQSVVWVVYSPRRLATIQRLVAPFHHIHPVLYTAL